MVNISEVRTFGFFLLAVLVLFLSIIFVTQATSVGTNVDVTGTFTANGNGTFGDASTDKYNFVGALQATSTLAVTGTSFLYGNVQLNGFATATAASGNLRTEGNIGVATTTSMSSNVSLGVQGTGTTTIAIGTSGATNVGSCIQLRGLDGQSFRVFAAATTSTTGKLVVEVGSCNGN